MCNSNMFFLFHIFAFNIPKLLSWFLNRKEQEEVENCQMYRWEEIGKLSNQWLEVVKFASPFTKERTFYWRRYATYLHITYTI